MTSTALPRDLAERLTCQVTVRSTGRTYVVVRPGLGLVLYYATPTHEMAGAVGQMLDAYLQFVPRGAITALCGRGEWGAFSVRGLGRRLARLRRPVDHTNLDLGSGPLLASEGPYGWHLVGGRLASPVWPDATTACFHELPDDEGDRVGVDALVDWAVSVAEIAPFESGQLGYSFNQLQRTWTGEADAFVGEHAMDVPGFDILDPALARHARSRVPSCSWLTFLGAAVASRLGGAAALRAGLPASVEVRGMSGGSLLLRAGPLPSTGAPGGIDLTPVRAVATLTRSLRIPTRAPHGAPLLLYGSDAFRTGWIERHDVPAGADPPWPAGVSRG